MEINFAHVHLLLNHLPIVGLPIVTAFLIYGLWSKNHSALRFALIVFAFLALIILPVYFSGEPAEDVIKNITGVTEGVIAPHEEAAETSLIITLIAGLSAVLALMLRKSEVRLRQLSILTVVFALAAIVSLSITANLGGKIRHTEFRGATDASPTDSSAKGSTGESNKSSENSK